MDLTGNDASIQHAQNLIGVLGLANGLPLPIRQSPYTKAGGLDVMHQYAHAGNGAGK